MLQIVSSVHLYFIVLNADKGTTYNKCINKVQANACHVTRPVTAEHANTQPGVVLPAWMGTLLRDLSV